MSDFDAYTIMLTERRAALTAGTKLVEYVVNGSGMWAILLDPRRNEFVVQTFPGGVTAFGIPVTEHPDGNDAPFIRGVRKNPRAMPPAIEDVVHVLPPDLADTGFPENHPMWDAKRGGWREGPSGLDT